jgi:hypothetical protein
MARPLQLPPGDFSLQLPAMSETELDGGELSLCDIAKQLPAPKSGT